MSQTTLSQVLADVGAFIDQDTTLPTGTELAVRVNLADQSQRKWAQTYSWKLLNNPGAALPFALSATSVGLDARFDEMNSPVIDVSLTADNVYRVIGPADRFNKLPTDKYCYLVGNDVAGRALVINPAMSSGASYVYDWQAYPSSLATVTSTLTIPVPQYVTFDVEAAILRSRADQRFPLIQAQADDILRSMIEDQDSPSGGEDNAIPRWDKANNYRIGRD